MKYRTRIFLLLVAGILLPAASGPLFGQQRTYTLEELKALATQNFEALKIQQLGVKQAALRRNAAGDERLPKLDADAAYTYVSKTAQIDIPISLPGVTLPSIQIGDGNMYSTGLTVSTPLFTGFRLSANVAIQDEAERIARQTLEGSVVQVRNAVTKSYLKAQLAGKTAAVLQAQAGGLQQTLDIAKNFVTQAQAIPYDTLVMSTRIAQLRVARANAEHQRLTALLVLERLTGLNETPMIAEVLPPALPEADTPLESLLQTAEDNRFEMKNFSSQKRIAGLAAKAQRGAYYPAVSAFAGYRYGRPGIDQFKNEWMDYFTAGVALKWNLWSWGADANRVQEQEIERQKTAYKEHEWLTGLRTDIKQTQSDIRLARQTMDLVQAQIAQEKDKNAIVKARYGQGLATATEVVDAETALTTAQLQFEQATIEYSMKLNELAGLLGKDI